MPLTVQGLATWLELGDAPVAPDPRADWLTAIVDAVVERIEERCTVPDPGTTWTASQELAGKMLAARLWRRRTSPEGSQGFDAVALSAVLATDADIAELLGSSEHLTGFG